MALVGVGWGGPKLMQKFRQAKAWPQRAARRQVLHIPSAPSSTISAQA